MDFMLDMIGLLGGGIVLVYVFCRIVGACIMAARSVFRNARSNLAEQGRRLASHREDLIADGVNPSILAGPLHPKE